MFGSGSTLPIWVLVLVAGVLLNLILGWVNPFVPKEYREKAKKFRENKFRQRAPLIMAYARFGDNIYTIAVIGVVLAFSILFFVKSYERVTESLGGGFMGGCLAFSTYILALALESALMINAANYGERIKAKQLATLYRKRYLIMLIFNESEFGEWIYCGNWARSGNLKDIMVEDEE